MGIEKAGLQLTEKLIAKAIKLVEPLASTTAKKNTKYMGRQGCDIALFGPRENLLPLKFNAKEVEIFTPYRRISSKPSSLTEPEWYIKNFESETQDLPSMWNQLSIQEKIDYIVNDRYSKLVSHRIMSTIKNEPIEHHFALSHDGQILAHDVGNEISVTSKSNFITDTMQTIDIHNHPTQIN